MVAPKQPTVRRVPPKGGAIPNLDSLRDFNPDVHQAMESIQDILDSFSVYMASLEARIYKLEHP
jgi:hypothetical protein